MRMEDIFHSLDSDVERMVAADNLFALFRSMAAVPGYESVESEDLCLHFAPPVNPMFRGVWRPRLTEGSAGEAIDRAIQWYRERDVPLAFWFVDPMAMPGDLGERLISRGFIPFEIDAPCMVVDLEALDSSIPGNVPSDFVIEEVRDAQALRDFCQGFVDIYELPEWAGRSWEEATLATVMGSTPWRMYVGRLHGEVAAINMCW